MCSGLDRKWARVLRTLLDRTWTLGEGEEGRGRAETRTGLEKTRLRLLQKLSVSSSVSGVPDTTGGVLFGGGGGGPPKNSPRLLVWGATMAERKPPRCCGASVSQRRGTMGAKPAFIPGALIWIPSLPLALVHKGPPHPHPRPSPAPHPLRPANAGPPCGTPATMALIMRRPCPHFS